MNNFLNLDEKGMFNLSKYNSFSKIYQLSRKNKIVRTTKVLFFMAFLILLLPWTQNITFNGYVTTSNQEERPHQLNNIIPGKIAKWYVKEGDLIKEGDTLLQLSEVKDEYFDEHLLQRMLEQIKAKEKAKFNYEEKALTAEDQMEALNNSKELKLSQLDNKISQQMLYIAIDSSNLIAGKTEVAVYERQLKGADSMLDKGAISQIEFEKRNTTLQNMKAKMESLRHKWDLSKKELENLFLEKSQIIQEYNDKIAKAEGDGFGSMSNAASSDYDLSKLKNIYANYNVRSKLYFVLSPINGQIGSIKKTGVGMLIKEGDFIAEILPVIRQKAIEIFIDPVDMPLIHQGQKIQFIFDGFPAFLFSGWPQINYGTFSGKISIIEKAATRGKFRALVVEDGVRKWPPLLSLGVGAKGIALLNDVPVFYEIWRQINGFPPEFYYNQSKQNEQN